MQAENKAKVLAMKSIMNNPKLSKVLEDGFNAPVGSTKRVQAKSVISILEKMGNSNDTNNPQSFRDQAEKLKKAKNPYSALYKKAFDGKGGAAVENPYDLSNPYNLAPKMTRRAPTPSTSYNLGYKAPQSKWNDPTSQTATSTQETVPGFLPNIFQNWNEKRNANTARNLEAGQSYRDNQGIADINRSNESLLKTYKNEALTSDEKAKWQEYQNYLSKIQRDKVFGYITPDEKKGIYKKPSDFGLSIEFNSQTAKNPVDVQRALNKFRQENPNIVPSYDWRSGTFTLADSSSGTAIPTTNSVGTQDNNIQSKLGFSSASPLLNTGYPLNVSPYSQGQSAIEASPTAPSASNAPYGYSAGDETAIADTTSESYNPLAGTVFENQWTDLSKNVQESLLSSLSAGQFATVTMADREKLRSLFPGVPDSQLPFGAGLQGQVDTLRDRLQEEYQLNEIADERNGLIKSGTTLTIDLTDYMKGRDSYIKSVDSMIDGVKDSMKTGLSDPATQAANKSYLSYLSVLKGRQNSRYIDLLNTSITHHDAVMADITNRYNTKYAEYKDELATGSELTKLRYDQMFTDLSNMFTLVQNGPALANETALQKAQIATENAKTISQELENAGITGTTNVDLLDEIGDYKYNILDNTAATKNQFLPNVSLYNEAVLAIQSGRDPGGILKVFETGISNTDPISARTMVNKFVQEGGEDLFASYGYTGEYSVTAQLEKLLKEKTSTGYKTTIESQKEEIINALKSLTRKDPGKITVEEFISDNSNVDPALLRSIWNFYDQNVGSYSGKETKEGRRSMFTILNSDDSSAVSALATQVAGY